MIVWPTCPEFSQDKWEFSSAPPKALTVQKSWAFLGREALCRQGLLRVRQGLLRTQPQKRTKKKTKAALLIFAKTNVLNWGTGGREAKWQSAACPQQYLRNQVTSIPERAELVMVFWQGSHLQLASWVRAKFMDCKHTTPGICCAPPYHTHPGMPESFHQTLSLAKKQRCCCIPCEWAIMDEPSSTSSRAFRWLKPQLTFWQQSYERPYVRTTQPRGSQIPDPQKLRDNK